MPNRRHLWLLGLALVGAGLRAAEPNRPVVTGAAFGQQLAEPVDISWAGTPLRQALYNLGHTRRVAVLLDRRVDPDAPLKLAFNDQPLEQVFREVARQAGLGMSVLGNLVYLGPPHYTLQLRTLVELRREEARALPDAAERLLRPRPLAWNDFATPRALLEQLAAENQVAIAGLADVPHDLWAGCELPPLAWVDRLTLLAGQFDLTYEINADGSAVRLMPLPERIAITRGYPIGRSAADVAARWAALIPDAQVKAVGTKVYVRGLWEDHERIAGGKGPPRATGGSTAKKRPAPGEEKRYTIKQAKGQLDILLSQLGAKFQLEVHVDEAALEKAGISLRRQVTLQVNEATFDELFTALLQPAGCSFRRKGHELEVFPAKNPTQKK